MSKELIVNEYIFSSMDEVAIAKSELEKINKLNEKLTGADNEILFKVYNKSIEKNTFKTPVGLEFMKSLNAVLKKDPLYKDSLLPIPVSKYSANYMDNDEKKDLIRNLKSDNAKKGNFLKWSLIFNIALIVIIIALFIITSTSNNPNIINYENALVDKYASWEMELTQKEKELNLKEKELDDREKTIDLSENQTDHR